MKSQKRPQAQKHYEHRRALAAAATPVPNKKGYKRPAPGKRFDNE